MQIFTCLHTPNNTEHEFACSWAIKHTHTLRNPPKIYTGLSFPSGRGTDQSSHSNRNKYTGEIPITGPTFSLISKLARYMLLVPCGMYYPCQILGGKEGVWKKKMKLCKSHPTAPAILAYSCHISHPFRNRSHPVIVSLIKFNVCMQHNPRKHENKRAKGRERKKSFPNASTGETALPRAMYSLFTWVFFSICSSKSVILFFSYSILTAWSL